MENRVPSSDANPYLAIAASLACGYLGLVKELEPDRPIEGASRDPNFALPRSILDAVRLLEEHARTGGDFRREPSCAPTAPSRRPNTRPSWA